MGKPLFRWAILGTAQIARKNWKAIRNSQNGIITVVASRTLERGRHFVAECQAEAPFATSPRVVGSYEEALAAQDVDGVYIPLPTSIRKEWVLRAAQAGKHVVCEKPCAVSVADLVEMLEASFITELQQWANISGTQGNLQVSDFVLPFFGCETAFETSKPVQQIQGCDFNMEPNPRRWAVSEYSNSHPSAQESNLFRHFAQQAQSGNLNEAWIEWALKTQQVMEACRKSSLAGGKLVELEG